MMRLADRESHEFPLVPIGLRKEWRLQPLRLARASDISERDVGPLSG